MKYLRILHYIDEIARSSSIRKAAENLNITSSALNRRVLDIEAELDTQLFERRASGVRLTSAGELFLHHLRGQIGSAERLRSQIDDLKGLRRGTVRIACSQAAARSFLPDAVASFRQVYRSITFHTRVLDHVHAMNALSESEVDMALVFRPITFAPDFQSIVSVGQKLMVLMAADHPLAERGTVRLSDCAHYPLALPDRSMGGRQLLEEAAARLNARLNVAIESNSFEYLRACVARGEVISFQAELGAPPEEQDKRVVVREIDARDVPKANLVLGRLRGRFISVASERFIEHLKAQLTGRATPVGRPASRAPRHA